MSHYEIMEQNKTGNKTDSLSESMSSNIDSTSENTKSQISNFFDKRNIFITGGAGFVGSVLIESLLRCCPGISNIYLLLREKKGLSAENRKSEIFQKRIFKTLKEDNPEAFTKVHVVPGDVTLKDLGISELNLEKLKDVSVVFHCAAVVSFTRPLRYMIKQNVIGTENVLELCKKLPNLAAFVHTSTAYSNCNRKDDIKEEIYEMSVSSKKFLDAVRSDEDDDTLRNMQMECNPRWPNTYTFSKAMAEEFLHLEGSDLPIAIVRPSIIIGSWKGSMPGYLEEGAGVTDISIGIGKGFIRVLYCDVDKKVDIIPVDVVVNTLIAAAWSVSSKKLTAPAVINCTSGDVSPCTWGNMINTLYYMNQKNPLPKTYQKPSLVVRKYFATYWASALVNHYAPALFIDFILLAMNKKPKLTNLYRFYDNALRYLGFFLQNEWRFKCDNFKQLNEFQNTEDKELFPLDLTNYGVNYLARDIKHGAPFYQWEIDRRPYNDRVPLAHRRYYLTTFIKWTVIIWLFVFIYYIVTKSFQRKNGMVTW